MEDPVRGYLQADDADLDARWERLLARLEERFGRQPNIEAILFLIGIQSHGRGYEPKLGREAKQDLIMEGTYCAFEKLGFYERIGADADGNWIWERAVPYLPRLPLPEQEKLLRIAILRYFEDLWEEPGADAS